MDRRVNIYIALGILAVFALMGLNSNISSGTREGPRPQELGREFRQEIPAKQG